MASAGQKNVVVRGSIIYLMVDGRWYAYDNNQEPLGSGAMGTVYLGWDCSTDETGGHQACHGSLCECAQCA